MSRTPAASVALGRVVRRSFALAVALAVIVAVAAAVAEGLQGVAGVGVGSAAALWAHWLLVQRLLRGDVRPGGAAARTAVRAGGLCVAAYCPVISVGYTVPALFVPALALVLANFWE